jgi:hypothetical protein
MDQLHHNVEAYMDDVVIKTRNHDKFIKDLEETFSSLCKFRWKLNSTKCIFGIPSRKLLGFIIGHRGIEANQEKITAITTMEAPVTIKDVQKLIGCMAALNRFISKLGERGLPFFMLRKRQDKFRWIEEADKALASPAVDSVGRRELLLYIAMTTHVISTAVMVERPKEGHAFPV